jgi:hypothetical protein
MSEGIKYDGEKPRTDLLDPDFLLGVSRVLTFGAKKYSAHNWRGGINYSRLIAAILRHTFAILKGEDIDPETGELHTAHLGCEVMFLHWMMMYKKELLRTLLPWSVGLVVILAIFILLQSTVFLWLPFAQNKNSFMDYFTTPAKLTYEILPVLLSNILATTKN